MTERGCGGGDLQKEERTQTPRVSVRNWTRHRGGGAEGQGLYLTKQDGLEPGSAGLAKGPGPGQDRAQTA